ncbi:MAG TPA: MXAN_6640 family putative metalloprotease [Gaiellaceae bacterium]|nr:MXAN_6640 family putative metalloprotease [Gaiellaceae bacterium]
MQFSVRSRSLLLASVAAVAVLAFAGNAAASERSLAAGAPNDALSRALVSGQITGAQYALQRALVLLAPRFANPRYSSGATYTDPHGATMALRDLATSVGSLSRSDRRLAMRLLARPTDGASEGAAGYVGVPRSKRRRVCTTRFCVHWVTRGPERPSLVDSNRNGRPDYVDKTVKTMNKVWQTEIGAYGYKRPRSDSRSGSHHGGNPNGRIDIFIADIGNRGLYGYCQTDDPRINRATYRRASAYCVFDNDFKRSQFPTGANRLAALRVTAAHEFFHAIQFGYDLFEDRAFMEGSATWMEDEVFDKVDDNLQYLLRSSPVTASNTQNDGPWWPIDFATPSVQYGTWIWYRFLSEYFNTPGVIRGAWRRAVGKAGYSTSAVSAEIAARGQTFASLFHLFGIWNTTPSAFYSEGSLYPAAGAMRHALAPGVPFPGDYAMYHMSNDYVEFVPQGPTTGLTITVNFPSPPYLPAATALVYSTAGLAEAPIVLDANGDGTSGLLSFDPASVSKVVLVLTNAGTRFSCWKGRALSCAGDPLDDLSSGFAFTATAS